MSVFMKGRTVITRVHLIGNFIYPTRNTARKKKKKKKKEYVWKLFKGDLESGTSYHRAYRA